MKFRRPLCIDYHARAQEIIITERDHDFRRAAQSLLSHRHADDRMEDNDDRSDLPPHHKSLVLNREDGENRKPSNSLNSDGDGRVEEYHPVDNSPSKSNDQHAIRQEGSNANAPRSILSIIALLGPAIHPSECALRQLSPVTRGPIRGRILPVDEAVSAMKSIEMHAKLGEEKFLRDISSLGGQKSRQQSLSIADASMFSRSGYSPIMDENDSKNAADETMDLTIEPSFPPNKLLRHEPDDLTKIQSLKALQMMTSFSSEVMNQMEPRQRKSSSRALHLVGKGKQRETDLSAEPKLSFVSCEMDKIHKSDFASNKNTLSLTSFYEDCHGRLADFGTTSCPILQSRKLKPHSEEKLFPIRLDPDFDPWPCESASSGGKMDSAGLIRSLKESCSVDFISQELSLPRRLEHKHADQVALTLRTFHSSDRKIEFVEKALNRFKESQMREEALLSPFVQRDLLSRKPIYFPKPIALESDLSLYDDESIEPKSRSPSLNGKTQWPDDPNLPSFAHSLPFSCARKTTHRSKLQKRFVQSSARVCKIDALSNICGPSKVACLYLPQIEVCDWKDKISSPAEQQHLASNDDLISFVRSCVSSSTIPDSIDLLDGVDLLQGQTSSYPILSWFTCDDDINGNELIDHAEVDTDALILKRKTFCSNAVRVGDKERSRCALLTGSCSRVNDGRKYSYRGFLTNQIVSPRIFQRRYKSMIELNKLFQRENISALNKYSDIAFGPRQSSFYFSRKVVVDFADKFSKKKGDVRRSPFGASLKTRRHMDLLPPLQTKNKIPIVVVGGQQFVLAPEIERLSSSFNQQKKNINASDAMGQLGRDFLNIRSELLHLVTKAHELKEEEDSYLAELALINRGALFEDEICESVDVADDSCANVKKREASDSTALEEHDDEKKKKRKRDKKKKGKKRMKREKKSHKRKHRGGTIDEAEVDAASTRKLVDDGCDPSSKVEESKLQSTSAKKLRVDNAVPSTTRKSWKAVPSIALGITPIHRPKEQKEKKSQTQPTVQAHETPEVPDKYDRLNTNSTHSLSSLDESSSGKSPDSVAAVANLAHGSLFTSAPPMTQWHASNKSEHIVSEQDGNNIFAIDTDNNGISSERSFEDKLSHLTILTSESFLEQYGESILELASGRWFNTLNAVERLHITSLLNGNNEAAESELDPDIPTQAKINVCDCPLLDVAGADIELADDKALIVQRISVLNSVGSNSGNKEFIRRLVLLKASGRYKSIHVILCVDTEIRPSEIVMMQNALIGCPCENVAFEYTSPRTLSSSIALQFCNGGEVDKSSRISQFASDENVQERARFLICLVPTMTVHNALRCLSANSEDDSGATAMQLLFTTARDTSRELFPHKVSSMMPKVCADQLWLAVKVAATFAST